jgi:hypothetical protein
MVVLDIIVIGLLFAAVVAVAVAVAVEDAVVLGMQKSSESVWLLLSAPHAPRSNA